MRWTLPAGLCGPPSWSRSSTWLCRCGGRRRRWEWPGLAFANSAAFSAGTLLLALPSRLVAWSVLARGAVQVAAGVAPAGALMWIASSRLPDPREGPAGVEHVALLVGVVAAAALVTIVLYRLVGLPFVRQLALRRPDN